MSCKMLFFDYRESEKKFFEQHKFENYDIKFFTESLNDETINMLSEEDFEQTMIISVFISSKVTNDIISKFKNLRVISTRSTGYDHIDLNSCINKNIALINVESYGHSAVAQFAFATIIMLVRRIYPAILSQTNKTYLFENFCGRELKHLTLGVVGTGTIGRSICKFAKCFDMRILAYDIRQQNDLITNHEVQYVELDALLKNADIVTLHLPYTKDNYHMFGAKQFELMKNNSYFVNVSRGELVDTEALLDIAKTGKFNGIALDVVACPNDNKPYDTNSQNSSSIMCIETSETVQQLSQMDNVIITPHIAYNTQEAVDYILDVTFKGLSDYVHGGRKFRVI